MATHLEEVISSLERAARWNKTEGEIAEFDAAVVDHEYAHIAERYKADAARLDALAKALREGKHGWMNPDDVVHPSAYPEEGPPSVTQVEWHPVLVIPWEDSPHD